MSSTIKVVKRNLKGWFSSNISEETLATEIQEQEDQGWQLISSSGVTTVGLSSWVSTDTLVLIYRKK